MDISELKEKFDYLTKENWELYDLHIIAPYPTDSFFGEFIKYFNPKNNLHLYIDDRWPEFKVKKIKETLEEIQGLKFKINRITTKDGSLVHAKIYFFKWQGPNKKYITHILIGSANPSLSGFGKNAETYALIWRGDINFPEGGNQFPIEKEYFSKLAANNHCDECYLKIGQSSWISLPEIRIVTGKLNSFDAWLQRGYLCHKFDHAANFGKFVIKTIKPIPSLDAFRNAGLQHANSSTQITYQYIKAPAANLVANQAPIHWKSQYFVETIYGHWASEDCYEESHTKFSSLGKNKRQGEIDAIKKMSDCMNEKKAFISKLQNAVLSINNSASDYLRLNGMQDVDERYYSGICDEKFYKDKIMASDDAFAHRYINGHAFPSFPTIDETSFEEFALSFCDEILIEINRGYTQNKMAKALKDVGSKCADAEELLRELRGNWNKYSEVAINYYKNKNQEQK